MRDVGYGYLLDDDNYQYSTLHIYTYSESETRI